MIPRAFILATALLVLAVGCGRIVPVEEAWFRRIRNGQLMPAPFSHELEVLGYQGWRYLGKLPKEAEDADAIRYRLWFEVEGAPGGGVSTAAEGRWAVDRGPGARRVEFDLILKRDVIDGEAVVAYRALFNGHQAAGRLPIPPGYRQSVAVVPATDPLPLGFDLPIPLGVAKLETWTARQGGEIRYFMRHQTYRWFIELSPERGDPLP